MNVPQFKPASECADCRLCVFGQKGPIDSPQIEQIVRKVVRQVRTPSGSFQVPIGVSARHCHLNREAMEVIFGIGSELTPYRDLYQPGAFAANEVVSVVGPRLRAIERVRILGPERSYNQVELARTDAIFLGLNPPVRNSGDLTGAEPITIIGPNGSITVPAAICATRHLHASPRDLSEMRLERREEFQIRIPGDKGVIFQHVRLKVDPSYVVELHLDTDDANAADVICGDHGTVEI